MMRSVFLFPLLAVAALAQSYPFTASGNSQTLAHIRASAPGTDWGEAGREAVMADVLIDGAIRQQVFLTSGATEHVYDVYTGDLTAGPHRLELRRNARFSAGDAPLKVQGVQFEAVAAGDARYQAILHAPVLFARLNTVGKFTDAPLLLYCERLVEDGQPLLQYTVIFTNEDGGTSTRALMARWGRTTDIEYIYRAYLDGQGHLTKATVQSPGHKDVVYDGPREGEHPMLMPVTDNNMVGPAEKSPIRYQLAPIVTDLAGGSREQVMDGSPWTYLLASKELAREGKIRPFGVLDGEKCSDPRNYLYLDLHVQNNDSAVSVLVQLKGEQTWRSSNMGRPDFGIERTGAFRTTVELPPGTKPEQVSEIGFQCLAVTVKDHKYSAASGPCVVESAPKLFFLDESYSLRALGWTLSKPATIAIGQIQSFGL